MRSKVLRKRGGSFIKPQTVNEKKGVPWGKYLYLAAIMILGIGAINWAFNRALYFEGIGYLESESKLIESPVTGRIVNIRRNINDHVAEGEALVFLSNPRSTYAMSRNGGTNGIGYGRDEAKILDLEGKISLLRREIEQSNDELHSLKTDHRKARQLLEIEAITRTELSLVGKAVRDLENNLQLLQIKYEATVKILELYKHQLGGHTSESNGTSSSEHANQGILTAPADGVVAEIYKQRGEIVKVGESILKLVEPNHNFIKTYFTGDHENEIRVGDEARVHFANGEESKGVIRKIYPIALDQPKQLKNRFGSAQRYIIAEIVPQDATSWERILETEVKVRVRKQWF